MHTKIQRSHAESLYAVPSKQQQSAILQLILVMFLSSPGAANLKMLGIQLIKGGSLAKMAQILTGSVLFWDRHYATLSDREFSARFMDDLFGDRILPVDKVMMSDYIDNQMANGVSRNELIEELTSALSGISPSDTNWGKAVLQQNIRNVHKVVDHLLADTFTATDRAIVVEHILAQMAAGKSLGEMIVWAIETLGGIDHGNLVWGRAAITFKNRLEVSSYYAVDKASSAIDLMTMRQIISSVTADPATVAAAKMAIEGLLVANGELIDQNSEALRMDCESKSRNESFSSVFQRSSVIAV